MRSLHGKSINNIHYLFPFYYCHIFPNKWHGILIIFLVVSKIFCLSPLNLWRNLLDPAKKRQVVIRTKVDSNKVICTDFARMFLGGCRDDHDDIPLFGPSMNLPPCQLQELPCLGLVLIRLEFIICLIESAFTSLLITNFDPLLCRK